MANCQQHPPLKSTLNAYYKYQQYQGFNNMLLRPGLRKQSTQNNIVSTIFEEFANRGA